MIGREYFACWCVMVVRAKKEKARKGGGGGGGWAGDKNTKIEKEEEKKGTAVGLLLRVCKKCTTVLLCKYMNILNY